MDKTRISKRRSSPATTILALLLVVCLAESATGSCLSYGHSCWGAHGKRSGRPPVTAPDWYLTRMLRRMANNAEMNRARQLSSNDELNAIYQVEEPTDTSNEKITSDTEEMPVETGSKTLEAKPMLDDELLSKIKLWQIMRQASQDK
ncbi:hypothetical protein ABMA28_001354 [Loxostege sticticalis]|uniref:Uncharacterized protein n=1 Tax=Loxostege sticticalis TaxID=481309 RepID=A0ABD0T1M8_LOXSC